MIYPPLQHYLNVQVEFVACALEAARLLKARASNEASGSLCKVTLSRRDGSTVFVPLPTDFVNRASNETLAELLMEQMIIHSS